MATKQVKKLSEQPATTTVEAGEKLVKVGSSGNISLIDTVSLKNALLGGVSLESMMDGIFIMYHRKSDNQPLLVKTDKWLSAQNSGEVADGLAIVEGGHILLVAATECVSTGLLWSSANVSGGATTTQDRVTAMADWSGRDNTTAIIAASTATATTNNVAYAPGYCNAYSRTNANAKGMTAGKWWMPSLGEMEMIYANFARINYALSLIAGATPLSEGWYWTSTETTAGFAWAIHLGEGPINMWANKTTQRYPVRPVSTFII